MPYTGGFNSSLLLPGMRHSNQSIWDGKGLVDDTMIVSVGDMLDVHES